MEDLNFKIDEYGFFFTKRAGKWKDQGCPFRGDDYLCGDWCPRFREVRDDVCLDPCIVLDPGTFIDERGVKYD